MWSGARVSGQRHNHTILYRICRRDDFGSGDGAATAEGLARQCAFLCELIRCYLQEDPAPTVRAFPTAISEKHICKFL